MRAIAVLVALLVTVCPCVGSEIPPDSLEKLGGVFESVRDQLWQENDRFWHEGDFERCIAALRLITEIDPHDTEAFSNASWLMWNEGRNDEAETFLHKGLALNRDVDDLYFELGFFYYNARRFSEAIECLENAAAFDTHWRTWHLLAHAYEHAGCAPEAFRIWLMMSAQYPNSPVPGIQIDRMLQGEPPPRVRPTEP